MKGKTGQWARGCVFLGVTVVLLVLAAPAPSFANGFSLGDAANFVVLYEGDNNQQLQFNNSTVTGNVGIGYGIEGTSGKFFGKVPGTINGSIEFAAANVGQYSNNGVTITGNGGLPLFSQGNVQADMNTLNALSQTLGTESGTAVSITNGGSVNANSGTLDGSGNYVFTVNTIHLNNNNAFTITGDGSHNVVFNISSPAQFNGQIVLSGGITSDQVLFNFDGGSYATLSGGGALTMNANCASQSCATSGIFLDPNGSIQVENSIINGRFYGGDTLNLSLFTGSEISVPVPVTVTSEPAGMALMGTFLMCGFAVLRRRVMK